MSFTSPKTFLLDGQEITYIEDSKVVKFSIHTPFIKAGQILGWPTEFGSPGLGINHAIIKFLEKSKCTLIIHIESDSYDCIIRYDKLMKFIHNHNNEYLAGGKKFVHVIPLKLCTGHRPQKEVTA
ncbi:MAG: hypothetical protein IIC67_07515 [Thaumarchaeota archaeon]|nr:hypothetical protein [Nitrososphaerota archaeon]